ncbi:LPS translocon maturation chaperone LptM [Melaminivora sp.]|uniref:LPS translocon maturation chaperone LptM n=1 Tax=Melaminivora sp. TaxID=1933032 RepID=UPI0028AB7F33|nr:lipoprotein [Melaminivora sp.]
MAPVPGVHRRPARLAAILTALAALSALAGCGQSGPLYLPTEPAAAQRASLPQTLRPGPATRTAPQAAPAPSASPRP